MSMTMATKERPIIFSAPMVRAIIDGAKTQTRRVVKPQPTVPEEFISFCLWGDQLATADSRDEEAGVVDEWTCPYGQRGDRLWVRENFYVDHAIKVEDDVIYYPADARRKGPWCCQLIPECACAEVGKPRIRPSIHMPRWASRLTLELTDVRVQRLQEISEEDARAEGVRPPGAEPPEYLDFDLCRQCGGSGIFDSGSMDGMRFDTDCRNCDTCKKCFRNLWKLINDKRPGCAWDSNPWVWALTFRRVEAAT